MRYFFLCLFMIFSVSAVRAADNHIVEVSDKTFNQEVVDFKGVVVVDFAASWCGPCRNFKPIFEEFALRGFGKFKAVHVDVDICDGTSNKYDVHLIPMRIIIKDGKEIARHTGLIQLNDLIDELKTVTGIEVEKVK